MGRLVILDRDGVINFDSPDYIKTPAEWVPIPGSLEAIRILTQLGYNVVIATNQAGVPKKIFPCEALFAIHALLLETVGASGGRIERIYACLHHPGENCSCRKPRPGMLLKAIDDFGATAEETCFVGDSETDVLAAVAAFCRPVLVLTGNGKSALAKVSSIQGIDIFDDLLAYAKALQRKHDTGIEY